MASLLALAVPAEHLKWLGLAPIALGVFMLSRPASAEEAPTASGLLQVTVVTIANGADNVAVYVPLFATRDAQAIAIMAAVFSVLLALWCGAARWLVHHPAAGAPLRRWGPRLVPWVLIALGAWILAGAAR
jgi:cadmium resistance protein CadD (predicted permease)